MRVIEPAPTDGPDGGPVIPLLTPRDGLPPVVQTAEALAVTVSAFAQGTGPVAIDAERASGYRYSHRAYLVQLRRAGAGTALIDPIACPDLSGLGAALEDTEWVLHAASQDLPCLDEIGMKPRKLFDTELAGRLLSLPKVGLGALVEDVLGFRLEKGHAAADWSTRPLPEPWLTYAALDVEVLVELRDALAEMLVTEDKIDWAQQEFEGLINVSPREPRPDPWRRTSGIHRVRNRRELAYVRELWTVRERIAKRRDIAAGRILQDRAIIAAAAAKPRTRPELSKLDGFDNRGARRDMSAWWTAVQRARSVPADGLPEQAVPYDGPPPARAWPDRDPSAAARLAACRAALHEVADEHRLPVENLLAPDTVRRLTWDPPDDPTIEAVTAILRKRHARAWQIDLTAEALTEALRSAQAASSAPADPADDATPG